MIDVSVVIVTYNSRGYVEGCINSLNQGLAKLKFELIVVDNGSDDGTREWLIKRGASIQRILNKENLGVAKSRNLGIEASKGRYVLLIDDDAYVDRGAIHLLKRYLDEHNEVALVGPKILYPNGKLQYSCRRFPSPLAVLFRGTVLGRRFPDHRIISSYLMKDFDHSVVRLVDWVLGACQLIRRNVFDQIGFLDEGYFFGYEDIDFCYRLRKVGLRVSYFPKAVAYHNYRRRSTRGLITKDKVHHIKSILRFFSKYYLLPR